ncbi:MAG: sensor histidine kinase [Adhaeribacter sp.]
MRLPLDTLLQQRQIKPSWRIASHVLFWVVFFGSIWHFNSISFNPYRNTPLVYLSPLRGTITIILIYYPLVYWVGLKLIPKKKWLTVIAASLGLLISFTFLDYLAEMLILNLCQPCREAVQTQTKYYDYLQRGWLAVVSSRVVSLGVLFGLIVYVMPAIAIKAGLEYHRQYIQNLKLNRDNIQLELNFLKAQLNPHFLFNTLNNLYGLIIHGRNEQSAETVARLSDLMRYTLYDSAEDKIALEKEVGLIKNYLELERLRLNYTPVCFEYVIDNQEYNVPPLLFMPLIENAFKYNLDAPQSPAIQIKLTVQDHVLHFCCQNSFEPHRAKNQTGGIGLVNLQKRLAIYYPGKHTYHNQINGTAYETRLTINLA